MAGRAEVCRDATGHPELAATYDRARSRLENGLSMAALSLSAGGDGERTLGPEGQTLRTWLDRLKEDARAMPRGPGGEVTSEEIEDGAGRPVSWAGDAFAKPPEWRLEPAQSKATRDAFLLSAQWLGTLLVVAVFSLSNFSRTAARRLWPEQLVLLGLACWHLAGPGLPSSALIVLGVAGRSMIAIRLVRSLFRHRPTVASSSLRT